MKRLTIAVLADVHGNYLALKACLDHAKARNADKYLFLGDYITDHPYPQRVMEQLYQMQNQYDCRFIRGNREDYMTGYRANGGRDGSGAAWKNTSAQGALLYCYENLTDRDIDWFESLPISGVWELDGAPPVAYCHGSPERTKDEMRGDHRALGILEQIPGSILVKGHNHRHWKLIYKNKQLVCAGSVGNPIYRRAPAKENRGKTAQMAFLHLENGHWRPEFVELAYDWQGALENLKTSGLKERAPVWAAMLRYNVLTGIDPFAVLPAYAAKLYAAESGIEAAWGEVPEKYWHQAAKEFGIETQY